MSEESSLTRLVRDIFATRDDEIQCEEARIQMARCAYALLSNDESRRQYPALWRHFQFCADCAREYRMVMELARLEAAGQLQRPARIPPPPDGGRPAIWTRARDAITALFPGFAPALAQAVTRGEELLLEPAEVTLAQGKLRIEFDLATNEDDPGTRDLFCAISTADDELQAALEGTPVWLQIGDEGPAVREQALDELGDVSFSRLSPGEYTFRLRLAGREYDVTGVTLP